MNENTKKKLYNGMPFASTPGIKPAKIIKFAITPDGVTINDSVGLSLDCGQDFNIEDLWNFSKGPFKDMSNLEELDIQEPLIKKLISDLNITKNRRFKKSENDNEYKMLARWAFSHFRRLKLLKFINSGNTAQSLTRENYEKFTGAELAMDAMRERIQTTYDIAMKEARYRENLKFLGNNKSNASKSSKAKKLAEETYKESDYKKSKLLKYANSKKGRAALSSSGIKSFGQKFGEAWRRFGLFAPLRLIWGFFNGR